jgi:DNA-binding NtrC family response regulator
VFVVDVPPLRERGDDVLLLATHFARASARAIGRREPTIAPEAIAALLHYPFPGNVRELRNMVEQAVLLARGSTLTLDAFPVLERAASGWSPPRADEPAGRDLLPSTPPPSLAEAPAGDATLGAIRGRRRVVERAQLVEALEREGGNVSAAARTLGLSRFQLLRRLAKHGLR